jgi:nicotinate-nucleotide pyrophosphorylase
VSQTPGALDRALLLTSAMEALLADSARFDVAPGDDPDAVGGAILVADARAVLAGAPVAKEVFGRMGARFRALVPEGTQVESGDVVGELGGPLGAIRSAAPTALRLLVHLSGVASGRDSPDPDDPLDVYAWRLSPGEPVGDDGASFHLEMRD